MNSNQSPLSALQKMQVNSRTVTGSPPLTDLNGSPLVSYDRSQSWQVAQSLFKSFKYAWDGVSYAFRTQRNFRIHTVVGFLAIGLSILLHLSAVKMAVIGLTIGAVMAVELLNTAIESIVDLSVGQFYHDLAKIAKDCAAGAVLIFALAAVLVGSVLILPPLWIAVQSLF